MERFSKVTASNTATAGDTRRRLNVSLGAPQASRLPCLNGLKAFLLRAVHLADEIVRLAEASEDREEQRYRVSE